MKTVKGSPDLVVSSTKPFVVIDASAEAMGGVASAVLAAMKEGEAVVMYKGQPVIGFRLMPARGCPCVGTPDEEDCPHE